jgi:hypothetical protein
MLPGLGSIGLWPVYSVINGSMKGVPSLSPLPLEGERARVRGNLISFPLPLILGAKLDTVSFFMNFCCRKLLKYILTNQQGTIANRQ